MVAWIKSLEPVGYEAAVAAMERRVGAIRAGAQPEAVWLLEHPSIYTAGLSARAEDISPLADWPVHRTRRGGQYTYHGPGQRVVYVMLDVAARGRDIRRFVGQLQTWVIAALAEFGVHGQIRPGRIGVWVVRPGPRGLDTLSERDAHPPKEDKIAAIGIGLRKWVSLHGIAVNIAPDLMHFDRIVPCGITGHGVTSLADLGLNVTMDDFDTALRHTFARVF